MARSKGDRFWRKFFTSGRFLGLLGTIGSQGWLLHYLLYHYVNEYVSNFANGTCVATVVSVPLMIYLHLFAFGHWRSTGITGAFSNMSSAGCYMLVLLLYYASITTTFASLLFELAKRTRYPVITLMGPPTAFIVFAVLASFEYQRACERLLRESEESQMPSHATRSILITAITTGLAWALVAYVRCRAVMLSASLVTFLAFLSTRLLMCAFDLVEFEAGTEADARRKANQAFRDFGRFFDSVAVVRQSIRGRGMLYSIATRVRFIPYANLAVGLVAIYVAASLLPVVWEIECHSCLYEWLLSEYETFRECGDKHILWEKVLKRCAPADDREISGAFAYAMAAFEWFGASQK